MSEYTDVVEKAERLISKHNSIDGYTYNDRYICDLSDETETVLQDALALLKKYRDGLERQANPASMYTDYPDGTKFLDWLIEEFKSRVKHAKGVLDD